MFWVIEIGGTVRPLRSRVTFEYKKVATKQIKTDIQRLYVPHPYMAIFLRKITLIRIKPIYSSCILERANIVLMVVDSSPSVNLTQN